MWASGGRILDDQRHDSDGLTVRGLDGSPEEFAALAARWLLRQLARPVERVDWVSWGEVVTSSLRLADTGLEVTWKEPFLRWRLRPPPVPRVTRVR